MVIAEDNGNSLSESVPHILVVDDIAETAQEVLSILESRGYTGTATTPDRVGQILRGAGRQPDIIVSDLRFVGCPGNMDNGLELAQRFSGNRGLVFLTGSIGKEALGNLYAQSTLPDGRTAFRGALKGEKNIPHFLAQVQGALRDAREISPEERAEHLRKVTLPSFNSKDFSKELENIIAIVAEKLRAYTQQTRSTLKILTEQHHLTQWSSWQKYQHIFETQLAYFESCNSEKICGNSDADAMNILHELRSRISLLDPSRLIPPPELQQDTANLLGSISHEYRKIDRTLQKAYQDGENICHPQFDIDRDAARIMRKSGVEVEDVVYYSRKLQGRSKFRDTNRLITSFFEALGETFHSNDCRVSIRRINENDLIWDERPMQKKLQDTMNWGGGYEIWVNIYGEKHLGKTYEQVLNPMLGTLQKLFAAKKIYINPRDFSFVVNSEYGGNRIEFFLKTEELDHEMLAQREAKKAQIQSKKIGIMKMPGSYGVEGVEVMQVTTPSGSMTVLGRQNPEKMGQLGGDWSVVKIGDEIILASVGGSLSGGHTLNDEGICHYLVKRLGMQLREAYNLAQSSVRLKLEEGCLLVSHEKSTDMSMEEIDQLFADMGRPNVYRMAEEVLPAMTPIVKELGVESVILSKDSFCGRNDLYWMSVDILEDPLYIDSRTDDMKDEWFE